MRLLDKKWLKSRITATGFNFQFKYEKEFEPIFEILYDKLKNCEQDFLEKKFEELWKTTSYDWNNEYGFRGYPSLAQWLEILVKKPLTDEEIEKRKLEFERNLTIQASIVGTWVNAPYYERLFCERYKNPLYSHIKSMIDTYFNLNENLTDDRIKKMAVCLKERLKADKPLFYKTLKGIARNQQQLLT